MIIYTLKYKASQRDQNTCFYTRKNLQPKFNFFLHSKLNKFTIYYFCCCLALKQISCFSLVEHKKNMNKCLI